MLTPSEQATLLVAIRVIRELLAKADNAERARICDTWQVGDCAAATIAGGLAGHVTKKPGVVKPAVTDPRLFRIWAAKRHPEAIETITRVNPALERKVLEDAAAGAEIPGVSVIEKDPYAVVALTGDAEELVQRSLRRLL